MIFLDLFCLYGLIISLKKINHYVIKLLTKDNKKINFNIYQCRGRFGLLEYFKNYKWNNSDDITSV